MNSNQIRQPNTQYILSLSYGKDSLACLEAIRILGLPLDRIVHAEVWATDTIPADLPPMIEFKKKADAIILERYGIVVEHICATEKVGSIEREYILSFERQFYTERYTKSRNIRQIYGFPIVRGAWCNSKLKMAAVKRIEIDIREGFLPCAEAEKCRERTIEGFPSKRHLHCSSKLEAQTTSIQFDTDSPCPCIEEIGVPNSNRGFSSCPFESGTKINTIQYLGIASDEPERIARHTRPGVVLPLVKIGWDEAYCRKWCEENDLLSPIYTTAARGGCWFCHNQRIDQLRLLRKNYPELWQLLLKWDADSPVSFHPDGHTVLDFDVRFDAEDKGLVPSDRKFRWKMIGLDKPKENENADRKTYRS